MADPYGASIPEKPSDHNWLTSRDPRALLLMTLIFALGVVSIPSIRPDRLLPFLSIPLFMTLAAGLSMTRVLARTAAALPFAILLGLAAVLSDSRPVAVGHGIVVRTGVLTGTAVVMKTLLTVWMAVILVSVVTFPVVTRAAGKLGMPGPLVQTMFFLYRYLQDMVNQVRAMSRAHRLRSGGRRRMSIQTASAATSTLLSASLNRGARVGTALDIRGFNGRLPDGEPLVFSFPDGIVLGLMVVVVLVFYMGFDRLAGWSGVL